MTSFYTKAAFAFGLIACSALAGQAAAHSNGNESSGVQESNTRPDIQKQLDMISEGLKKVFSELDATKLALKQSFEGVGADMKKLQDSLKKLEDEKLTLQLQLNKALSKVETLEQKIGVMQTELESMKKSVPDIKLYPPKAEVDDLKNRVAKIESAIDSMKSNAKKYVAGSSPQTGRLVLINQTPAEVLFIINEQPYRVSPQSQRTLEAMPVGNFRYEVIAPPHGAIRNTNTQLNPNETLSLIVG